MLKRWCWNWQTGVVEGHVPVGRAGSTPAQRIPKNRLMAVFYWGNLFYLGNISFDNDLFITDPD